MTLPIVESLGAVFDSCMSQPRRKAPRRSSGGGTNALLELALHRRPLRFDHREDHGVAIAPVGTDALVSQRPFEFGAKLLDGGLRMQVLDIRLERNADGMPVLEGMAHEQVLGLRIDNPAPLLWRVPRPADLDRPIVLLHIEIAGAADHPLIVQANDNEWILSALRLG